MLHSVTVNKTLDHPIEDVWAFVVDGRNDEEWCPMVSDCELVEGEPGEGALYRYAQSQGRGQPPITVTMRTTVANRPTELAWEAESGVVHRSTMRLEVRDDDRTRVVQTNTVQLPNPLLQVAWYLGAQAVLRSQLRRLAAALATGGGAS